MAAPVRDSFLDLQRYKRKLAEDVDRLVSALHQCRMWDAEYEQLMEELEGVDPDGPIERLTAVRDEFVGEFIQKKDLDEIFGRREAPKAYDQVRSSLRNRLKDVAKNSDTLEKHLGQARDKLDKAMIVSSPDAQDDDGLPITDIIEKLDENDNVVSYKLQKAGDSSSQIQEALSKAGIKDVKPDNKESTTTTQEKEKSVFTDKKPTSDKSLPDTKADTREAIESTLTTIPSLLRGETSSSSPVSTKDDSNSNNAVVSSSSSSSQPKKSVVFTEDTKPEADSVRPAVRRVQNLMEDARAQEEMSSQSKPFLPEHESEEDAQLRREMLEYGLNEMGAIVAEMQLDGLVSDSEQFSDGAEFMDEDEWEDEDDDDTEESADEDNYGRSKRSIIPETYHQRMRELEMRLGVQSRFSRQFQEEEIQQAIEAEEIEKKDVAAHGGVGIEGVGRIVVRKGPLPPEKASINADGENGDESAVTSESDSKPAKSVRFAEKVDVAPAPKYTHKGIRNPRRKSSTTTTVISDPPAADDHQRPKVDPIGNVMERPVSKPRAPGPITASAKPKASQKPVSRFRQTREEKKSLTQVADTDIPDITTSSSSLEAVKTELMDEKTSHKPSSPATISDVVLERETITPTDHPDDVDDEFNVSSQEIAQEYHAQRRRLIQKENGFVTDGDVGLEGGSSIGKYVPDPHTEPKKMSRFRAARLSQK